MYLSNTFAIREIPGLDGSAEEDLVVALRMVHIGELRHVMQERRNRNVIPRVVERMFHSTLPSQFTHSQSKNIHLFLPASSLSLFLASFPYVFGGGDRSELTVSAMVFPSPLSFPSRLRARPCANTKIWSVPYQIHKNSLQKI